MIKNSIKSALGSLVPFWSNEIVKVFVLGNEYTMAITVVLSETVSFLSNFLNDELSILLIFLVSTLMFFKWCGINIINTESFIKSVNSVTVIGTEKHGSNESSLHCSTAFKAVNLMLIKKYSVKKLIYLKDSNFDVVVDNLTNHQLEPDLFVSVKRDIKDNNKIFITLSSYNLNIDKIISEAIKTYDDDDTQYKLKLVGIEPSGTSYNYPEAMRCLNYVLVNTYGMKKLKILSDTMMSDKNNPNDKKEHIENLKNANKKPEETETETIDELEKRLKNIYLLESCKNHRLDDDIFITIERSDTIVTYTLLSNSVDLKIFLKQCIDEYKTSISAKDKKYVLKFSGTEVLSRDRTENLYPKWAIAFCDKLITENHIGNFRLINCDNKCVKIIDEIKNVVIDDILVNTIRSVQSPNFWEKYISTTFVLESSTVNLNEYIEQCVRDYEHRTMLKNDGNIYYFKYLGKFGKDIKFSKCVLSSETNKLHETFDTIYNEHSDRFKKDIEQLKDDNYYKRTGLRKKKAYLFHGEPGCGKNASVIAMALYDKRHIIDVPFSILQYNSEFHEIMNLTSIDDVYFNKNQIIYMFDEMHSGLAKITNNILKNNNENKDLQSSQQEILDAITLKTNKPVEKMSHDSLDLGCVLSLLDGIGNYGGVIYVGLTNYIDKIPEPLKRSLRLTPVHFTYMRQFDVVKLLENFFDIVIPEHLINLIPDRRMTPARLRVLCEQNIDLPIDQFIDLIVHESKFETRENYSDTDNTQKYLKTDNDNSNNGNNKNN